MLPAAHLPRPTARAPLAPPHPAPHAARTGPPAPTGTLPAACPRRYAAPTLGAPPAFARLASPRRPLAASRAASVWVADAQANLPYLAVAMARARGLRRG